MKLINLMQDIKKRKNKREQFQNCKREYHYTSYRL